MATTAMLSTWLSNTATAMLMMPIAASTAAVIAGTSDGDGSTADRQFAPALMLGVAYAANVGGLGTLIGTLPNAVLAAFLAETYGLEIGFGAWMAFGVPLVLVLLPAIWLLLIKTVFPAVGRMAANPRGGLARRSSAQRVSMPWVMPGSRCSARC